MSKEIVLRTTRLTINKKTALFIQDSIRKGKPLSVEDVLHFFPAEQPQAIVEMLKREAADNKDYTFYYNSSVAIPKALLQENPPGVEITAISVGGTNCNVRQNKVMLYSNTTDRLQLVRNRLYRYRVNERDRIITVFLKPPSRDLLSGQNALAKVWKCGRIMFPVAGLGLDYTVRFV